ncbi:CinA family protein [Paraburkholderia hayleyella]|uniref:CinA family protein n=1 Tax=Paraburkholderia hayleyella TaxID=2152889 RepID=UPI0012929391|nr:CinA family protein [Paraburkholderia hayleyella]
MSADTLLHQLAQRVGERLHETRTLLATAESCTGGMIASAITGIAGSSGWFERGFVTYSNQAKNEMLGVPVSLIDTHGAVSEPVARAMAEGALCHSQAQVTLSVTGIAGPGGGTETKPVGTVAFGWSNGTHTQVETRHFKGDRQQVRHQAALHALHGLLRLLDQRDTDGSTLSRRQR